MGNQANEPRDVTVTVVVDDVATGRFHFETTDLPLLPDNVLKFDNKDGHAGFNIRFALSGAEGYSFPNDVDEALWVKGGSKTECPKTKSTWGQFKPIGVEDEGRTLKVLNKNDTVMDFAYTLRASKDGQWLALDPGGMNQNGGGNTFGSAYFSTETLLVAGAVLAVAAVAFLAFK